MTSEIRPEFPTDPSEILAQLECISAALLAALDGLNDDDLSTPDVVGTWRLQDVLAHLARWDSIAWQEVTAERAGQPTGRDYSNYLALNDQWAPLDHDLPPAEARARFETAHQRLMDLFAALTADEWTRLARRWAKHAVWLHYPEHTAHVLAWRAASAKPSPV